MESGKVEGSTFMHIPLVVEIEKSGHPLAYETIEERIQTKSNSPYILMRGHIARWTEEETAMFRNDIINCLRSLNYVFMTPTEYYWFCK